MGRQMKEEGKLTVWDKRDHNYDWKKKSAKLHFQLLHTDLFVEDQNTVMLSEDRDKTRK